MFGPLEPPNDYRIFNRRRADGTFPPLSEFFEQAVRKADEAVEQRLQADMACACPLDEFGMYQMPALPDGTCPTCRKPYR